MYDPNNYVYYARNDTEYRDFPDRMLYTIYKAKDVQQKAGEVFKACFPNRTLTKNPLIKTMAMLINHGVSFCPDSTPHNLCYCIPDEPLGVLESIQRHDISPQSALIKAAYLNHPKTTSELIALFPLSDADKHQALVGATHNNSRESTALLLNALCNPTILNKPLYGPDNHDYLLTSATWGDNSEIALLLLRHGADVHINNDAPLISATRLGALKTVKIFLEHGADVRAQREEALMYVGTNSEMYSNNEKKQDVVAIIKLLIGAGARIENIRDSYFQKRVEKLLNDNQEDPAITHNDELYWGNYEENSW
jgi:ankyrin repeat protein